MYGFESGMNLGVCQVRALKKLALRKQIEEKRRENEQRRRGGAGLP